MQDSYPIKDTFNEIIFNLQAALDTKYVIGLLVATAFVCFVLGRLTK